jgi:hypothetical protein
MSALRGSLETQLLSSIAKAAAAIIILLMIAHSRVSDKVVDFNHIEKINKKQDEEITPEEELHNFLLDLKQGQEQKEKYKAITGKDAPRDLSILQIQQQ